jgi:hypothetical protein
MPKILKTLSGLTSQEIEKLDPYQRLAYENAYHRFLDGSCAKTYHDELRQSIAKQIGLHTATSTLLEPALDDIGLGDEYRLKKPVKGYLPGTDYNGDSPLAEVAFVTSSVNLPFARALQRVGIRVRVYSTLDNLARRNTPLDVVIHDERTNMYQSQKMMPIQSKFRNKTLILAGSRYSSAWLENHHYNAMSTEDTYNDLFNRVIELTGVKQPKICLNTLDDKIQDQPFIPERQPEAMPVRHAVGYGT